MKILEQRSGLTPKISGARGGPREGGSNLADSPEIIYVNGVREPGSYILAILRRFARALTVKAVRGTAAIKGTFDN